MKNWSFKGERKKPLTSERRLMVLYGFLKKRLEDSLLSSLKNEGSASFTFIRIYIVTNDGMIDWNEKLTDLNLVGHLILKICPLFNFVASIEMKMSACNLRFLWRWLLCSILWSAMHTADEVQLLLIVNTDTIQLFCVSGSRGSNVRVVDHEMWWRNRCHLMCPGSTNY